MAECYWPGVTRERFLDANKRAGDAGRVMKADGTEARCLDAILVLEDEIVFFVFESASAESVIDLARRAELPFDRVVECVRSAVSGAGAGKGEHT